ncbi:hypothetical protein KL86DPRO_10804 [uncultured delta proteobacterium]|uniref:Uncharacterized protein n=1 Tax=uncultured delta proteobacterium TaxID=34034 RepID=A0A212J6K5_9DELT|nr:hypothetical protein KL86DPRO_10804 [uncultured delta proteobacterium]
MTVMYDKELYARDRKKLSERACRLRLFPQVLIHLTIENGFAQGFALTRRRSWYEYSESSHSRGRVGNAFASRIEEYPQGDVAHLQQARGAICR